MLVAVKPLVLTAVDLFSDPNEVAAAGATVEKCPSPDSNTVARCRGPAAAPD
jgi:hypothetical protein